MLDDVIKSIVEAEDKAEKIIKKSNVDSKAIVLEAREKAAEILDQANNKIKSDRTDALNGANLRINDKTKIILDKAEKTSLGLKTQCFKNMIKAEKFITKEFKERYGNS